VRDDGCEDPGVTAHAQIAAKSPEAAAKEENSAHDLPKSGEKALPRADDVVLTEIADS
jgi:hypothetical protein